MPIAYESVNKLSRPDKHSNIMNEEFSLLIEKDREFYSYLNQLIILIIQNF